MAKKKSAPTGKPAIDAPSFEQALAELERIVHELEEGELGLEESLARYEQGVGHLRRCHRLLERAERKIELLTGVDAQGREESTPLDDEQLELSEKADRRSRRRSSPASSRAKTDEDSEDTDEPEVGEL